MRCDSWEPHGRWAGLDGVIREESDGSVWCVQSVMLDGSEGCDGWDLCGR